MDSSLVVLETDIIEKTCENFKNFVEKVDIEYVQKRYEQHVDEPLTRGLIFKKIKPRWVWKKQDLSDRGVIFNLLPSDTRVKELMYDEMKKIVHTGMGLEWWDVYHVCMAMVRMKKPTIYASVDVCNFVSLWGNEEFLNKKEAELNRKMEKNL